MKLKTSLFKKGLIISDLKRFWWVSALYTLALLFILPLNHYVQKFNSSASENLTWLKESISRDLLFQNASSQVFLLVVPIVIGALVFMYIQKSRSASLYHSLPLTRAALYFNSVISALILFVVPLLFNTLIMFLLNWFSSLSTFYSSSHIFTWLLYSLLFGIMFIAMTIFVGMFTGSSIAQLAFVYILNFLPIFLVQFVRMHLTELLYGFDTYSNVDFFDKMPMIILLFSSRYNHQITPTLVIIYITVTIALFIGGLYAFKLRKPETAGDIITFKPIRPIFIYGVTICATLLGGAYLMSIGNKSSFAFIIFGYFISSLISYVIVQMITNKSFKVLHTYKGYICFALVLVVLAIGIKFDAIGYVNKIPAPSDVAETYIGYNLTWWENKDNPDFDIYKYNNNNYDTTVYKDPQNIENITKLHKFILDNRSKNGSTQYIAYKMKNGKNLIRKYIIDTDMYASVLGPIYETKEYKEGRYPILYQDVNDLKYIQINDNRLQKNPFIVSDKVQLKHFKTAIMKDISTFTYQDLIKNSNTALNVSIFDTKDGTIQYNIGTNFSNTIGWLKQEGIYDQIVIKPDYVNSVTLQASNNKSDSSYSEATSVQPKSVEITDSTIIQELLDLSFDVYYRNKTINYDITFTNKGNSRFYGFSMSFDDKVSPALLSYVDKIK